MMTICKGGFGERGDDGDRATVGCWGGGARGAR